MMKEEITMTWKRVTEKSYECDNCGGRMEFRFAYCPFCGAEALNPYYDEELDEND